MNLLEVYSQACAAGDWQHDREQEHTITTIAPLVAQWQKKPRAWRMTKVKTQWLYLWGPSGTGKTKLMDLVCQCLPKESTLRMHFVLFMAHIETLLSEFGAHDSACTQVIHKLAKNGVRIICLDEFYVDNITDAMVLGRLLEAAEARGIAMFFTSNAVPELLYPNGLQRDRFMRTIERIENNALVHQLSTKHDYRQTFAIDTQLAMLRALPSNTLTQSLANYFTHQGTLTLTERPVPHQGMRHECIWFHFADLCETPRHASDYRALVDIYKLIVITDIPVLTEHKDDAARRFILLVDILYDYQTPCLLFTTLPLQDWEALYQHTRLKRVFMRTASRLQEMQSAIYLQSQSDYITLIYENAS